jgi:hypothetical protein
MIKTFFERRMYYFPQKARKWRGLVFWAELKIITRKLASINIASILVEAIFIVL